jgi:hypothetical protein
MQPDEALLIRVHDSANDSRARLSFHTSFYNPLTPGTAAELAEPQRLEAAVFFGVSPT